MWSTYTVHSRYIKTSALRMLELRGWRTLCPPEAPFGRLWSPLINYMGDNILNTSLLLL